MKERPDLGDYAMSARGQLVGRGRSADVFEYGDGRVLRRYRQPHDTEREVAAMEHARQHGFPVPWAQAVSDTDIVMDRVTGPTMLSDLERRPWLLSRHARTLAMLHGRLHEIPALPSLSTPLGDGNALLHLDLHPDNVLLSEHGPVVIDWPNAASGPAAADVAHTLIVLSCAATPGGRYQQIISALGRRLYSDLFLRHFKRSQVLGHLRAAGEYRLSNRTLPQVERRAIERLIVTRAP